MNQYTFVNELRGCLSFMTREERDTAISYYEEYFAEAGPERVGDILAELGSPSKVAEDIRRDYFSSKEPTGRDLAAPGGHNTPNPEGRRGYAPFTPPPPPPPNTGGWAGGSPPNPGGRGGYAPPPPNSGGWGGYAPPRQARKSPGGDKTGFPTWLIVLIVLLAVPVGLPLACAALSLVIAAFSVILALLVALCGTGLGLFAGGIYVFVSGFWALGFVPNALMLFGAGLLLVAFSLPLVWLGIWIFSKLFKLLCRGVSNLVGMIIGKKGESGK